MQTLINIMIYSSVNLNIKQFSLIADKKHKGFTVRNKEISLYTNYYKSINNVLYDISLITGIAYDRLKLGVSGNIDQGISIDLDRALLVHNRIINSNMDKMLYIFDNTPNDGSKLIHEYKTFNIEFDQLTEYKIISDYSINQLLK